MTSTLFASGAIGAASGPPTANSQSASAAPAETAGPGGRSYRTRTHSSVSAIAVAANSNVTVNANNKGGNHVRTNSSQGGNNANSASASASSSTLKAPTTAPPSGGAPVSQKRTHATILHAHRQSHNSSKLPAFRFADLKESLALPSLRNHIPPSPVSPVVPNSDDAHAAPLDDTVGQRQLQLMNDSSASTDQSNTSQLQLISRRSSSDSVEDRREQQRLLSLPATNPATAASASASALPASPISPAPAQPSSPLFAVATPSKYQPSSTNTVNNSITPSKPGAAPQPVTPATTTLSATTSPSRSARRPTSYPDSPPKPTAPPASTTRLQRTLSGPTPPSSSLANATRPRRNPSSSSDGTNGQSSPLTTDNTTTSRPGSRGQRELLLAKTLADKPADDKKKTTSRPPVSFRAPRNDGSTPGGVIPPIRGFRSSGSRKSLVLDMNTRNIGYEEGDMEDPNHRDRTLRALEGRADDGYRDLTPPDSAGGVQDDEDTTDIFMKIARENSGTIRRSVEVRPAEEQSAVSRVVRSSHRRPLSAAVPSYQPTSPPQVTRRLSDQRENSRPRRTSDDRSAQQLTKELNYRSLARDKPSPSWQQSDTARTRALPAAARSSPITPRTAQFYDTASEVGPVSSRRRPSVSDSNTSAPTRSGSYRTAGPPPRSYNPSPLAPRHPELQRNDSYDQSHGREGTESSASTAAPSTVWDELDDLKSRMRRLELTGKIPPTSGAAMSRVSDDRPRTATTNATTVSGSPKRVAGATPTEVNSTTSSQRDAQPILLSAMAKAKSHLPPGAYSAIESAANDALALSQMVGVAGQLGPISSGASTIGTGGPATVTDRQLRRKADSICRSLTELCLALNDAAVRPSIESPAPKEREPVLLSSPIAPRVGTSLATSRLPAGQGDRTLSKITTSPRALTRLDDKRPSLLNSPAIPTPRFALGPNVGAEVAAGRKSSLLIGRTRRAGTEEPDDTVTDRKVSLLRRRAGTEEPEDMSNRKPSLLRTRRAETEEPEEDRRSTVLVRSRMGVRYDDEDQETPRFRAPSRAFTEVTRSAGAATAQREYQAATPAGGDALATSPLPRRRLSRLIAPSTPTASLTGRRFADRPAADREPTSSIGERLAEERGQRHLSLGQTAMLNRTSSLNRRRESAIPSLAGGAGSQLGAFR